MIMEKQLAWWKDVGGKICVNVCVGCIFFGLRCEIICRLFAAFGLVSVLRYSSELVPS